MLGRLCIPGYSRCQGCSVPRIAWTLGMLWTPGCCRCWGCSGPPRLSCRPPAELGSLQSSVPGAPELLRAPRCRCCSWSRQERPSSLRRGPGCSQPSHPGGGRSGVWKGSLPRQRSVQPAGRCESGCVQVPARLSPAAVDAHKGCRNADRGGGAGGERRR